MQPNTHHHPHRDQRAGHSPNLGDSALTSITDDRTSVALLTSLEAIRLFCNNAQSICISSARVSGVKPSLLERLESAPSGDERIKIFSEIRDSLKQRSPGCSIFFPDFSDFTRRVHIAKSAVVSASNERWKDNPPEQPEAIVHDIAQLISLAMSPGQHKPQQGTALLLMNSLARHVRESMPNTSKELYDVVETLLRANADTPRSARL